MAQLALSLPVREALGRADFFISPANALAVATVGDWGNWPQGKLVLVGPEGAGKTHLANIWASETGAMILHAEDLADTSADALAIWGRIVIEDAHLIAGDHAAEVTLFHLHNMVLAQAGLLLLTAQSAPNRWPLGLPDLASRLQATAVATLTAPDDALLSAVLVKLFADRQITVPPSLIPWLVARIERSFSAARDIVDRLDRHALAQGRPVSRALAAELLDSAAFEGP
ncbi:chromosomal replication initiator DnaA [Plastorhodobacter daqingensis]|uniref:Chromosomal replication initiator DnaA n=1 Tax=Plastorhodobacter daqingensis TaxID=1387281 RepID=A0ABW2UML7_9RHOB